MSRVAQKAQISRDQFASTVSLVAGLEAHEPDPVRRAALKSVLSEVERMLLQGAGGSDILVVLPSIFCETMLAYGWLWNGFYLLGDDGHLHLGPAKGPPVCSQLERRGGPFTSGMCFDALLLNQLLVVADVKLWPGYVSCDVESGLNTLGGITCPLRDPNGRAFGVWDLDATQVVTAGDGRLVEALFSTLSLTFDLAAVQLG